MPFIRYNRDKRGYETTLVVHGYRTPQGSQRNRVLYLFRSPSNLQVGRRPLDEEVVEALEHTHPDLTFDWPGLLRDRIETRPEPRQQRRQGPRGGPPQPGRRGQAERAREPEQEPVVIDDQTVLGQVLGATDAARLRRRYAELLQRIARRARTPEDRDRLSDRARRLNPDDWADEVSVRAGAAGFDAEADVIAEELPQRRRGRRGGRGRSGLERAPGPSAIMDPNGDADAVDDQQVAGTDRDPDTGGDSRGIGGAPDGPEPGADDVPG